MIKYFYTFFLLAFLFSSLGYAQNGQLHDKGSHFVQTDPGLIHNNVTDVEEIFGSNAFSFGPLGTRGRGNLFTCTTSATITEHRLYINPTSAATLWFCIYEADAQVGTYNQISSVQVTNQGPGVGWYSSGAVSVNLTGGKYYLIYCQWDVTANYYNQQSISPYPIPCSFGQLTAGAGWSTGSVPIYGNPPPATQSITAGAFADPVAYYQAIVSDVIPVELTSFTASTSGERIKLDWQTASETNNYGFEVERKASGQEFTKIGFVAGYGTTTETKNYNFIDKNVLSETYTYRLKQVDFDGTFEYSSEVEVDLMPSVYSLSQNYPNPFNPNTNIKFSLKEAGYVKLAVYNTLGEGISVLANGQSEAGFFEVNFDASNLSSGTYIYRLETPGFVTAKKMLLMK